MDSKFRALALLAITCGGCASAELTAALHALSNYRRSYAPPLDGRADAPDNLYEDLLGVSSGYRSPQSREPRYFSQDCAFAVAISGGGTVSASFSYGALKRLAEIQGIVPQKSELADSALAQVDYFSTASGGGITAAEMIRMLGDANVGRRTHDPAALRDDFDQRFDALTYKKTTDEKYLTKKGITERLFGCNDGQSRLERLRLHSATGIWCDPDQPRFCSMPGEEPSKPLSMRGIFPLENDGGADLPIWVPNATAFGNGRRVPLTPHVLSNQLGVVGTAYTGNTSIGDLSVVEPLAASMAFPGIGPYRMLRGNGDKLDLVDGGLADNLGAYTALDLLGYDLRSKRAKRAVLLVIDSSFDADLGLWTRTGSPPSGNDYVSEMVYISLWSQYRDAKSHLVELARARGIDLVFVSLSTERRRSFTYCQGLGSEDGKGVGVAGCPSKYTAENRSADWFISHLTSSLAVYYQDADYLMQMGYTAVDDEENSVQGGATLSSILRSCIAGQPSSR
jgi:hypothetical protein